MSRGRELFFAFFSHPHHTFIPREEFRIQGETSAHGLTFNKFQYMGLDEARPGEEA